MFRRMMAGIVTASLALCAVPLAGCSAGSYEPQLKEPTLSAPTIGEDGTLRVGVNTDQSPLAGKGKDKIIGIDVDIAAALADELGLTLSIVDVGSDPVSALEDNKIDIAMGIDSADSSSECWLSDEYLPTAISLFASSGSAPVPTKESDPKIAAQISSKSAWAVTNEFGAEALQTATNLGDAFNQLASGSVDYVASDAIIGLYAAHRQGVDASIVALMAKPTGYCVGILPSNTDLQAAVDAALSTLVDNGTIDVIEKKWLGTTLALSTIPLTAGAQSATTAKAAESSSDDAEAQADSQDSEGTDGDGDAADA